ncbi:L-lysine exporter family protein LysE/ArgO [Aeromonas sp. BIGb0405]|nr:L-lysine exporter family protein LysE/ArgO [Aeromonas sp. BIGb0405]
MIIPIGAQNAFVLSRGIHRNHHLLTATLCCLCDLVLIGIGVFGGASLLAANPLGLALLTWGGVLFLSWFGVRSLRSAWRGQGAALADSAQLMGVRSVLAMTLGVTLLNPHVYLDTLMLLGSLGSQFAEELRPAFAAGAMLASLVWFYGLAFGAAALSPWLARGKVQQAIDVVVGLIMIALALQLAIGALTAS